MNIQGQFATDEDRAARRLIERAGIIIKSARGDVPESFAPLMFAGVPTEDLARYEARELAELAEAAWAFLQERKPGRLVVQRNDNGQPLRRRRGGGGCQAGDVGTQGHRSAFKRQQYICQLPSIVATRYLPTSASVPQESL